MRPVETAARAALVVAFLLGVTSCGGGEDPFRLAVQVDCQGSFEGLADDALAGAFLPLLERGGHLQGASPGAGVEGASIAGRPVEVKVACTESFAPTYEATQLRTLVEEWHPDAVVGGGRDAQGGLIVRDLGRRYPDVAFVVASPPIQEVTLGDPAPNVFRIGLDNAQSVAGLGAYAYKTLGWRRVAVVGYSWNLPDDWEQAAGFMAEFCALGGTATRDDGRAWSDPRGTAARYAGSVDGIAVLPSWLLPTDFLRAVAADGDAAKRLLIGGWAVEDHRNLAVPGADLDGVVVASHLPLDGGPRAWRSYVSSFARAYPSLPPGAAAEPAVGYRNAVEALATALEDAHGDKAKLHEALATATVQTVPFPSTFDANRQVVTSILLSRLGKKGVSDARALTAVDGVEQTYGGVFGPPKKAPTASSSSCDGAADPPPWAR